MNHVLKFCFLAVIMQLLTCMVSLGQMVTIQPAIPSVGMLQASQMWNISAINVSSSNQIIRIDLMVLDRATGGEVLKAEGMEISLKPGATLLNNNMLSPVKYSPLGFFTTISGRDFLPVGQYTLCYSLFVEVNKNLVPAAKECIAVDVEPMTPPYLNYPFNKAVINEKNPRFVWIPPTPMQLFSSLQYDFLLVEKNTNQTPEEAIQRNTPMMVVGNLPTNSFGYNGVGMAALDTGKQYAWQVIAKNGAAYGVKSEVWSFMVAGEKSAYQSNIIVLSDNVNKLGKSTIRKSTDIIFHFNSRDFQRDALIELRDFKGGEKLLFKKAFTIVQGDNYFNLANTKINNREGLYLVYVSIGGQKKFGTILEIIN